MYDLVRIDILRTYCYVTEIYLTMKLRAWQC